MPCVVILRLPRLSVEPLTVMPSVAMVEPPDVNTRVTLPSETPVKVNVPLLALVVLLLAPWTSTVTPDSGC